MLLLRKVEYLLFIIRLTQNIKLKMYRQYLRKNIPQHPSSLPATFTAPVLFSVILQCSPFNNSSPVDVQSVMTEIKALDDKNT